MTGPGPSHLSAEPLPAETGHWAHWARNEPDWDWPGGKSVAVTITFDIDAETAWYGAGDAYLHRLTPITEGRFSVVRGVPRILELFRRFALRTTFFIPGWTAENYPHVVESILNDGHEIGHHGYVHSRCDVSSPDAQREEIERGFAALDSVGVPRPRGYRNPWGEMTGDTLDLVHQAGFLYDSSFQGDDRPYVEKFGEVELLELPWYFGLDDWPYFGYATDGGGNTSTASSWRVNMWDEYQHARDEGRNVNYVCHPEIIGRGYRFVHLAKLLEDIVSDGRAWIPTLEELALHVQPKLRKSSIEG
jgi:peptidoglycan/xylan/chitin deacetylase (PgdA/CDA1 family)